MGTENQKEINSGIENLNYDANKVLAFSGETISNFLPKEGEVNDGKFIVVTKTRNTMEGSYDIAVPNAYVGSTYPGALLLANQNLTEGSPNPLVTERRKVLLSIDLPGLTEKAKAEVQPTYAEVSAATQGILNSWYENEGKTYAIPANMQYRKSILYDEKAMALKFGCDVEYMQNKLGIDFSMVKNQKKSAYLIQFKQIFYTVSVQPPVHPSDVFGENVKWNDLKSKLDNENPPVYVLNVQYGREVYMLMESDLSSLDLETHLNATVLFEGGKVDVDTDAKAQELNKRIKCTIITLGGKPVCVNGNLGADDMAKAVNDLISENVVLSAANPAYPLCYTTAFLKDNKIASIHGKTEYVTSKSEIFSSGELKLKHDGAYVAKFHVSWDEISGYDKDGKEKLTKKNWDKNGDHVTASFATTITLPANAKNIRVTAEGATGLAWEPWRKSVNTPPMPLLKSRSITISGTTLNQKCKIDPEI